MNFVWADDGGRVNDNTMVLLGVKMVVKWVVVVLKSMLMMIIPLMILDVIRVMSL